MLNVKLLAGSFVGAAGALKLWTDPGRWGVVLDVIGALIISWAIFVAVLYLTALRMWREPSTQKARPLPRIRAADLREQRSGSELLRSDGGGGFTRLQP